MDSGDGRIERELHPLIVDRTERSGVEGHGNWEIRVWTSDIRGAGTDANVTLQVSNSVANRQGSTQDDLSGGQLLAKINCTKDI